MNTPIIGWTYDKSGNAVEVYAAVNAKLQPVKPHTTTQTGAIPDDVGCATNKWDFHRAIDRPARPTIAFGTNNRNLYIPCYQVK